jgi:hypothetical protein
MPWAWVPGQHFRRLPGWLGQLGFLLLLGCVLSLVPLARATPPDPSWIAGVSAAWAHAFQTPGDPTRFSANGSPRSSHNQADMAAIMAKFKLSQWASLYWVGADLINGAGAHYCLGPSGHGLQVCSRIVRTTRLPAPTCWRPPWV